jgi:hypothetical protein
MPDIASAPPEVFTSVRTDEFRALMALASAACDISDDRRGRLRRPGVPLNLELDAAVDRYREALAS